MNQNNDLSPEEKVKLLREALEHAEQELNKKNAVPLDQVTVNGETLTEEVIDKMVAEEPKNLHIVKASDDVQDESDTTSGFMTPKNIFKIVSLAVVLPVAFAFSAMYVKTEYIDPNVNFKNTLSSLGSKEQVVTVVNNEPVDFISKTQSEDEELTGVNTVQKALSGEPARFMFSNGQVNPDARKMEVFLDIGSQQSRDFVLLNQGVFRDTINSGKMNLDMYIVPTSNPFSVYGAEALAEISVIAPDKAFDFVIELLKESATLKTDRAEEILESVVNAAQKVGVSEVNEKSIRAGTFAQWLLTTKNDQRLSVGYYPPLVYLDGVLVDNQKVNVNVPGEMFDFILGIDN